MDVSKAIDKAAGAEREVIGNNSTYRKMQVDASAYNLSRNPYLTAPATEAAKQWQGWGTALKPAYEPIIVARKPLEGTVAANVQKWGTGALNIDASRIGTDANEPNARNNKSHKTKIDNGWGFAPLEQRMWSGTAGRFPANLILDEEAAALLDEQSGEHQR